MRISKIPRYQKKWFSCLDFKYPILADESHFTYSTTKLTVLHVYLRLQEKVSCDKSFCGIKVLVLGGASILIVIYMDSATIFYVE